MKKLYTKVQKYFIENSTIRNRLRRGTEHVRMFGEIAERKAVKWNLRRNAK
jgi:hypothetical protein